MAKPFYFWQTVSKKAKFGWFGLFKCQMATLSLTSFVILCLIAKDNKKGYSCWLRRLARLSSSQNFGSSPLPYYCRHSLLLPSVRAWAFHIVLSLDPKRPGHNVEVFLELVHWYACKCKLNISAPVFFFWPRRIVNQGLISPTLNFP